MTRVAIMGSGSWGTAFGMVLADAGSDVVIWGRSPEVAADINVRHRNEGYHPGIDLPDRVTATTDPGEALADASIVVLAVPAQVLRANLGDWSGGVEGDAVLVSLMKGIELGTTKRMSQVISEAAGVDPMRVAVVSGPNLAREIAERQPAATTVASPERESAQRLQDACTTDYVRPYWTTDVIGTEIGGAVKNVIALACGMADGLGFGHNTRAAAIKKTVGDQIDQRAKGDGEQQPDHDEKLRHHQKQKNDGGKQEQKRRDQRDGALGFRHHRRRDDVTGRDQQDRQQRHRIDEGQRAHAPARRRLRRRGQLIRHAVLTTDQLGDFRGQCIPRTLLNCTPVKAG